MKKSKVLSLLLSLSLLASLVLPGALALPTRAADGQDNSGMVISKTAEADGNGGYKITLEAYATGEKIITETKTDVPTDIVLVLDQSGSMEQKMSTYSFQEYTGRSNAYFYSVRHNGSSNPNLYYKLGDDESYASVSVTIQQGVTYTEITNETNYYLYSNRNNLYAKVNGQDLKVEITYSGYISPTFVYTLPDNTKIGEGEGWRGTPTIKGTDDNKLYLASVDVSQNIYTYTYTDKNDVTHTIGSSTGASTIPEFTLYERYELDTVTRLEALKSAVSNFADSVSNKAAGEDKVLGTGDDVNHRIAVVGFATGNYTNNSNYPKYENTELFIGATQYNYNVNASSQYGSAFQNMSTQAGYNNIIASKNALAARGATYPNYGLQMAKGIFDAYPIPEGERRNRVVILFTDGTPGYSEYDSDVAKEAVDTAKVLKDAGVTVYSVGIFDGADATSDGIAQDSSSKNENQFMQDVSSNNGKPQNPSYYLSASDANTLNNIFQQISNQIESGGSTATLGSETVIKDIISPSFALPAGATAANITLETYQCTGKNGDAYTWSKNDTAMDAQATVNDAQVSVTGFDFKEHYVGTVTDAGGNVTYRGHKLVISFTVKPKAGFLGGNDVYTNTMAGIYENDSATEPVLTFERPQVNVPIQDISITKSDKNVYLLENLTAAQIRSGVSVKVGNVDLSLDPTANNYGLEAWQTEYVTISTSILDENNLPVSDLKALTSDKTYSISVSVAPRTPTPASNQGQVAVEQTGSDSFKINVFKPVLTFKDGTVDYGSTINTTNYFSDKTQKSYESDNYVSMKLKWMHESTDSANVTMLGTEPVLTKSYQYDITPSKVDAAGKVISKDFVGVDVTVKIGSTDVTQYVTFAHDACASSDCTWDSDKGNFEFLLHVINKCADLTIQKLGIDQIDNDGTKEAQSVIFHIKGKTNGIELDVVIHGNGQKVIKDLPIDTYIVTEKTDWSWRYTPDNDSQEISLDAGAANSLTFTNTRTNSYWLNGGNYAHNVFGN